MIKTVFCIVVLSGIYQLEAQINRTEFFSKVNTNYYALETSGLQNFSSWVTSNSFNDLATKQKLFDVYPLEIIWIQPNEIFFIQRPLPAKLDSVSRALLLDAQRDLQSELQLLLPDWTMFFSAKLLSDMPADYSFEVKSDTVFLTYTENVLEENGKIILKFSQEAQLLHYTKISADSSEMIQIKPDYKFTGEFWLCGGWQKSLFKANQLVDGVKVNIISKKIGRYWLPSQIQITSTMSDLRDKLFLRVIDFRNVRVDRDIQLLNRGN